MSATGTDVFMLPEGDRKKLIWASPLNDTIEEIIRRRGQAR